ncbi:lipopolysaccharide biosynthesis protein [Sphingomonas parva]|uniref:lipopolysaccharide biosynthesis protein n=1 Tax=Sphingomonas parva TaxID=2555898 RepID=UPI0014311CD2|nr:oligosaccharide flippase family protein [Sphingomonas parva]
MNEDSGRLILHGARATGFGFAVRLAARLLFLFVAGRLYGAAVFGSYALALAAVELAVSVGSLGTKKTLFQLLDRHRGGAARPAAHALLDSALLVLAASLALGGVIALFAAMLPPETIAAGTATALLLLAPAVAGQALLDLFLAATRWTHVIRDEIVARSIVEPWALLAGCVAGWGLGWRVEGLAFGYGCGTLAALLYAASAARRRLGGLRLRTYRPIRRELSAALRGAADNTGTDLLNALYLRVDLYLVGVLLGEAAAGIYNMARQIAAPLRQIRQSFDGLLIPLVARSLAVRGGGATSAALASATRLVLVLQLPLLLFLFTAGGTLLAWLGPTFTGGYWALVALAAAETIQAAFSIGDLVFVYLRPRLGLGLTAISIALGIAAALLLIPQFGTAGAGLAVLLAYGVRALLRGWALRARFAFAVGRAHHAGPVGAAALGAAASLALGWERGPWWPTLAALAVYAAALQMWMHLTGQRLGLTGLASED